MQWKTVIGFELYSVSESGLVKNNETGLILSQGDCGSGYLHVRLHGKYNKLVHRLVAEAFLENEDGKDQIHHKDGNKHNNAAYNLEWCNQIEHQTIENGKAVNQILNGTIVNTFRSLQEASRFMQLSNSSNIRRACKTGMKCKGYHWEYAEEASL